MMNKNSILIALLSLLCITSLQAQDSLRIKLNRLLSTKQADVGVAVYGFEHGDTISINGNRHYPLQSVFKFHIALAVLHEVDKGKFALDQKVFIKKEDLFHNTWSPILKKYPEGNVSLPLDEILRYTVSQSDNNGCDILLRMIGGPKVVHDYIQGLGITAISIQVTEEEMHQGWDVQFKNWTTPKAAVALLDQFYNKKLLSAKSHAFLLDAMIQTTTGTKRIKGQLPPHTIVAHKTGTSGTNEAGIMSAVHDIGVVTVTDQNHFAISVFVSNSKEGMEGNEKIIAEVSKLVWDYFQSK